MERNIVLCREQFEFNNVLKMFETGWMLDPEIYGGRPLRLENSVVYHMIKYTEEEAKALQEQETQEKIVSIQSVPIDEADTYLEQGYELKDTYAKTVTVIKKETEKSD